MVFFLLLYFLILEKKNKNSIISIIKKIFFKLLSSLIKTLHFDYKWFFHALFHVTAVAAVTVIIVAVTSAAVPINILTFTFYFQFSFALSSFSFSFTLQLLSNANNSGMSSSQVKHAFVANVSSGKNFWNCMRHVLIKMKKKERTTRKNNAIELKQKNVKKRQCQQQKRTSHIVSSIPFCFSYGPWAR